jgi:hypothetical protein
LKRSLEKKLDQKRGTAEQERIARLVANPPPRYAEWLHYCFHRFADAKPGESAWDYFDLDGPEFEAEPAEVLTLFETTMRRAGRDLAKVPDQALSIGMHMIFYPEPAKICDRLTAEPHLEPLNSAIDSIGEFYVECLDKRNLGYFVDGRPESSIYNLATTTFMIWDMSPLAYRTCEHHQDLLANTLGKALMACSTAGCQQSALHGLGHLRDFRFEGPSAEIIARLLHDRSDLNDEVVAYAKRCATGFIR